MADEKKEKDWSKSRPYIIATLIVAIIGTIFVPLIVADKIPLPQACSAETSAIDWPQVGSQYSFGGYPWRVLDVDKLERKVLLLSEEILAQRPYNDNSAETTWADCTLKEYLNEDFYDSFSPADKARILLTINDNPDNPSFGTVGGEQTKDYVFLLSVQDVLQYFPGLKQGKYDWYYEADERLVATYQNESSWWWLRSPGYGQFYAARVNNDGYVGLYGGNVRLGSVGVRPALWLNLEP